MKPNEIQAARLRLGMTQAEFGAKLHRTAITVCYWETGRRKPKGDVIQKIKEMKKESKK